MGYDKGVFITFFNINKAFHLTKLQDNQEHPSYYVQLDGIYWIKAHMIFIHIPE